MDLFLRHAQRTREWSKGEYFSILDVLTEQKAANATLKDIRSTSLDFYQKAAPELFKGIESIVKSSQVQIDLLDHMGGQLRSISHSLNNIEGELFDIRNSLNMGFEMIAARLDVTNSRLAEIVNLLANPIRAKADELVRRGLGSLKNAWFEEAMDDFSRAIELEPTNHVPWYFVGTILTERMNDLDEGKNALDKAAKYAKPFSSYYYSSALYQYAVVLLLEGDASAAFDRAKCAFEADRRNLSAAFLASECSALLSDMGQSIKYLSECESRDSIFFLKATDSKILRNRGEVANYFVNRAERFSVVNKNYGDRMRVVADSFSQQPFDELQGLSGDLSRALRISNSVNGSRDYLAQRVVAEKTNGLIAAMLGQSQATFLKIKARSQNEEAKKLSLAIDRINSSWTRENMRHEGLRVFVQMGVWVLIVVLGVAFWSRGFEDFTERPHLVLGIVIFTLITAVPLAHYGSKAVSKHVYKMLEDGARIRRDAQLKTQKNKLKQFNAELISQLELTEQQLKSLQGLGV